MRGSLNNSVCTLDCSNNVGKCGGSAGYLSVFQISGIIRVKNILKKSVSSKK